MPPDPAIVQWIIVRQRTTFRLSAAQGSVFARDPRSREVHGRQYDSAQTQSEAKARWNRLHESAPVVRCTSNTCRRSEHILNKEIVRSASRESQRFTGNRNVSWQSLARSREGWARRSARPGVDTAPVAPVISLDFPIRAGDSLLVYSIRLDRPAAAVPVLRGAA